jgi:predicted nucleic acid-binding protein
MALALFDTNILIDHLAGIWAATEELAAYDDAAISTISWMEVACKLSTPQLNVFSGNLSHAGIKVIQTTPGIMRRAAMLRSASGRKLPDCIIMATAELQDRTIITRDLLDFNSNGCARVRVPYRLLHGQVFDVRPLPR